MIDQLIINGIGSLDDFGASVKERSISPPKKKRIKETVPYSNTTYDFSKINGELYWEERTLEYVFEMLATSAEELEEKMQPFRAWLLNVHEAELHDPFIQNHHFIATYADMDIDDREIEKATVTVTFTAYPYMIADVKRIFIYNLVSNEPQTVKIINNSNHRIVPTFKCDAEFTVIKGNTSYGIPAGEITDASFWLEADANTITLQSATNVDVYITFVEEVF